MGAPRLPPNSKLKAEIGKPTSGAIHEWLLHRLLYNQAGKRLFPAKRPNPLPAIPWAGPHSVPAGKARGVHRGVSNRALCRETRIITRNLHTCLGMGLTPMNYDVLSLYGCALRQRDAIEPVNFLAQFKY